MGLTESKLRSVSGPADPVVSSKPVTFGGCFGWFHAADGDVGVVLCSGIGLDGRVAHRFYFELANRLAASGYPTLRFDYLGTGDSLEPADQNQVDAWCRDVHEAVASLRSIAGISRIVLCGMRLGAMLAAIASESCGGVEGLILLAPVISGESYARELTFMSRLHGDLPREKEAGWLETDDVRLPDEAIKTLETLDLRKLQTFAPQVLILAPSPKPEVDKLTKFLEEAAVSTSSHLFINYADIIQISGQVRVPEQDIQTIVNWCKKNVPVQTNGASHNYVSSKSLRTSDWIETPLRFDSDWGLFGVLCRPSEHLEKVGPVIIVVNTGVDPHHGLGRFSVLLARKMARMGIASFRMDFKGLGDSAAIVGQDKNLYYDVDRSKDVTAAVNEMQKQGFHQFGVLGVCSGAFHAFHATLNETRISFLVSVNQAFFRWKEGDSLDTYLKSNPRKSYFYLARLTQADDWQRLLRGQVDILTIVRGLRRGLLRPPVILMGPLLSRISWLKGDVFPRQAMSALSRRGVQSLFLLSAKDSTFSALENHFGSKGKGLLAYQNTRVQNIASSDHTLSRLTMREEASDLIVRHLCACASGSEY